MPHLERIRIPGLALLLHSLCEQLAEGFLNVLTTGRVLSLMLPSVRSTPYTLVTAGKPLRRRPVESITPYPSVAFD